MRRTYKYKLYRHKHNWKLHRLINIGGAIHNHLITLHRRYYRLYKKYPSPYQMRAHLAKRKRLPKYAWWKQLNAQAIQQIVIRVDRGYRQFFQNVRDRKAGKTTLKLRPPTYRKLAKAKSFTMTVNGWKLLGGNRLRIQGTVYKFAKSREIEGAIKTVAIKRDTLGDFYVYFSCLLAPQATARVMTGKSAGFDFGFRTYLTGHDGSTHQAPLPLNQGLKHIAQNHRRLSSKAWYSNNYWKTQRHLARAYHRITHVRQAFHWELAYKLCTEYDHVTLETLHIQNMKRLWGRKVSDLGYAGFVLILHHVASKLGTEIHHIDRWFPSSKLCSTCGRVNENIGLRDRIWTCEACGTTHRRDQNAALNIYREGASSRGGDPVRLAPVSSDC